MSLISVTNLSFAYEGSYDNIFENVSFQLDSDWKLGFTGRNGRGKTTFLNLLLGKYEYKGNISASVEFEYFPFEVKDSSWNTLDIAEEFYPHFELWELQREISLLDMEDELLYRPFETLSKGEQTKIMLAVLFLKENSFLLIDEPTNHLDIEARELVSKYLNSKNGFILVSHDRNFLDSCTDHTLSINKANIEVQKGNFSSWLHNKELQDQFEIEKNEKLKKEIKRLEATTKEKAKWSDRVEATKIGTHQADRGHVGHLAAKIMKRSKAIEVRKERELEEKSKLLKNIENTDSLKIFPVAHHAQRLIEFEDVSIFYGEREICSGLNFTVNRGDRAALLGKNGSGKSSILKIIMGEDIRYEGRINIASGLKISYVSQDTSKLNGSLSEFAERHALDETVFRTNLRKLDLPRIQFEKKIEAYSEGQKKKVLLAKSLTEQANLYIWDEPLNYIDIFSRMQLEELLLEYEPTLIFVEHDKCFSDDIATKQIKL